VVLNEENLPNDVVLADLNDVYSPMSGSKSELVSRLLARLTVELSFFRME
jgi:hypothetical protein